MRTAELVFWVCVLALLYAYAGFPLLVLLVGSLRRRVVRKAPVTPHLTLIVAAYNEEGVIAQRLENALAADYPPNRLEIIVASDGSTDATAAIVACFATRGVRLLQLPRMGKIAALNAAVLHARGHVLVFSDANTMMDAGALRAIAACFADPAVGGVVGNTGYRLPEHSESSGPGERSYWQYDSWLKEAESRAGSVVSAHGGLYAIRSELYCAPTEGSVTDDFTISTAVVEQGKRLVFERDARAWEFTMARVEREFRRRVRLMTRGMRAVSLRRRLLNPFRYGFYSLVLFSHKVVRRVMALPLIVLFIAGLTLGNAGGFYTAAASAQLLFYGVALLGWLTRRMSIGAFKPLYLPFFFCMANAAALVALARFVRGDRIALWQPQRTVAEA